MKNNLAGMRRARGIKQVDLARHLGISASYLCKIEREEIQPTEQICEELARFFGVDSAVIFGSGNVPVESAGETNKLWAIRTRKGLKQCELARKLDCSPSYLSKIEKGLATPSSSFRRQCARLLKTKESEIFPL